MRKFALTIAAAATLAAAGSLLASRAEAMTATAPAGLGAAVDEARLAESIAYVCRNYWNGYRWVRRCYYTRPYYRPYRYYRRHRYYRY